jgi:hypothetical protein
VQVADEIFVANIVGQHGYRPGPDGPAVRYPAIATALSVVADRALELKASVHMPRIGCGLAGGRWEVALSLIT